MWTGQRLDSVTGNYYMLNRHYVPSLGKFLQRDPARYGGGDNMYAFGGGDPINNVDPSGLGWFDTGTDGSEGGQGQGPVASGEGEIAARTTQKIWIGVAPGAGGEAALK